MMDFVHLHNHTEYSLLDGAARVQQIVVKAKEMGMPAVAITDHGVMYGVINFYRSAMKAGIKPIIGCEVYVAPRGRFDKEPNYDSSPYHLVLLAKNNTGYKNLCQLVSSAFLEGFYYKPRVDKDLLRRHADGLIALSACLAGELPRKLLAGIDEKNITPIGEDNITAAKEAAKEYIDIFGAENFYIELQNHNIPAQRAINPLLARIAKEVGVGLVATNDVHYLNREDSAFHDILLCVQTGQTYDAPGRMRFSSDDFYLKSQEEMALVLGEYPEAFANTVKIAEKCNISFVFDQHFLPNYQVPEGYNLDTYLTALCYKGLKKRYPEITEELTKRLEYELSVIRQMDFPGYFLIVWDMINFCRESKILVGPGRGSAAGSLVAYCLGITNIDPIKYNLLFERFLNPERVSMPDIDTDFCYVRRGEVIDYLVEKYGEDKVGQIITFGTLKAKAAVKDVGRALNMPFSEVNAITKLIPNDLKITITKALESSIELRDRYQKDEKVRKLLDYSRQLEGMPRHASTHAAGVVIAREPIVSYMPVQKLGDGIVTTQFEKDEVEQQGLLKMDLLGLRTLTVIGDAVVNIKAARNIEIDIDNIPLDDPATYDMLCRADTSGVFQLESSGMRKVLRNLHPESLEDIIALVALYRPGPLGSGMVDDFIDRKNGRKKVKSLYPLLDPILKETYGVMLYQEQVMQAASVMGGFSLGQADVLRKAMGKKKHDVLMKQKDAFLEGAKERNIPEKKANEIFDLMEHFSEYGFNKSHSAAYAFVSYQTAWLKANYPVEYMAALLTSIMDTADRVPEYLGECRNMGIAVLPPDINESYTSFTVVGNKIRFGLAAVKNIGREAVHRIIEQREENGPFRTLPDLCRRVPLNRKMLESLISCGALDCFGEKRAAMLEVVEQVLEMGRKATQEENNPQMSLFDFNLLPEDQESWTIEMPQVREFPAEKLLAMEKEMLGFYVSGHPLEHYKDIFAVKGALPIAACHELDSGTGVKLGVMISSVRSLYTKRGESMASCVMEDSRESIQAVIFPRTFGQFHSYVKAGIPVIIEGKLDKEEEDLKIIVEKLQPPQKLYLRLPSSQNEDDLALLKEILASSEGSVPVSIFYQNLAKYHDLSEEYLVDAGGELIDRLKDVWGVDNVILQ